MPGTNLSTGAAKVCAVVVTFNRKSLLKDCLVALLTQSRPLDEVIVIDNASTDGTEEAMRAGFPGLTYLRLTENQGGAGGFHEGMRLAFSKGHDWIWVMDDDAVPRTHALERLLDSPLAQRGDVYGLASAVLNNDGSISILHRRRFDPRTFKAEAIPVDSYRGDCFEMDEASFVGLLIRRKAVGDVGFPLKEFFIYYDDTEYSLRLRRHALLVTVPNSLIIHGEQTAVVPHSVSRRYPLNWKMYYGIRNRVFVYGKYGGHGVAFYRFVIMSSAYEIKETLLYRCSKSASLKIVVVAVAHGLLGRLGKNSRFLPP